MNNEALLRMEQEQQDEKKRCYTWSCVTYMSEENLRTLLKDHARNFAYIKHDDPQDLQGKEPHTHVVITFEQQKSFSMVGKIFDKYGEGQGTRKQPCNDIGGALLYLTHESEGAKTDGKFQYNRRKLVLSKQDFYDKYVGGEEITDTENFVEDLIDPHMSPTAMAKKYGRDFIRNFKSYMYFRKIARIEESSKKSGWIPNYENVSLCNPTTGEYYYLNEV